MPTGVGESCFSVTVITDRHRLRVKIRNGDAVNAGRIGTEKLILQASSKPCRAEC